jgi:hypothetical protein
MIIQNNCNFVTKATESVVSKSFSNHAGDTLSFSITGATGVYYLEGRNHKEGMWCPLAGINLSDFSAVRGAYTQPGLYEIGILGVRELRVRVESVDGEVTIFGQIISSEES